MRRIIFTVTNDLNNDQRMDRSCTTLQQAGYEVLLVGRKRRHSQVLQDRPYNTRRIPCLFDRGKLFYLEYNFKLFWFLLFRKADILCAVDLDTILPVYLVSRIRSNTLVYDAHEFFTEMEEIVRRPLIHRAWKALESFMMRRVQHAYTISDGYARMYKEHYGVNFKVIRNVPNYRDQVSQPFSKERIIQYQGALNVGRGLEASILAMKSLPDCRLRIYGDGPKSTALQQLTKVNGLSEHVSFKGMIAPALLREKTRQAWLGLTLFSETGLHHRYSLANRFFDYIHAGVPQIAMDYPEYRAFNEQFEVAILLKELTPEALKSAIELLFFDPVHYDRLKENCNRAAQLNCWQLESEKLLSFYQAL